MFCQENYIKTLEFAALAQRTKNTKRFTLFSSYYLHSYGSNKCFVKKKKKKDEKKQI